MRMQVLGIIFNFQFQMFIYKIILGMSLEASFYLDCDIGCTMYCKVHLGLNIYPFGKCFFGFERLECKF